MLKLGWYSNKNMGLRLAIEAHVSKTTDYYFGDELTLVAQIKEHNIDISGFKLPYHCRTVDKWLKIARAKQEYDNSHRSTRPFNVHDGSCSIDPPMIKNEDGSYSLKLPMGKNENTE